MEDKNRGYVGIWVCFGIIYGLIYKKIVIGLAIGLAIGWCQYKVVDTLNRTK